MAKHRQNRQMTSICFVCNLPIMSHQVGLVWQGGNGWDEMVREQLEESTIRQRLGGRRDSAAQISAASPPSTSPPPSQRRRRSSLAQLTDILLTWSGGGSKRQKAPLNRRETLADLARSLPWSRNTDNSSHNNQSQVTQRKRRESSADSGIKSMRSRHESHTSDFNKIWQRKESPGDRDRDKENTDTGASTNGSRRGSSESFRSARKDSAITRAITPPPKVGATKKRRDSLTVELPNFRLEQRPSTSSTASDSGPYFTNYQDTGCQVLPPPTIVTSSVTPPATSPTAPPSSRRDSTTQCGRVNRRDSRVSPERPRLQRLQRQSTAYDESCPPLASRRESQPALSPTGLVGVDGDEGERRARRDSLSPDSASRSGRRDSRQHLSPDRSHDRDSSPRRRSKVRRQSSSLARNTRSPESSSCCSSRDASPCARAPPPLPECVPRPAIRRQSTTEEILISRGFRRQSTTEEMIRCRNFRRQSSQSDDTCRYRGRRDSCAQITDGTIGTMTVETTSTFFDSSTQTEPSPLYDNNQYHEECLRCNSCGINLSGQNHKRARRFKNQILCDLHFADVALMAESDFMQQLRSFKPQSLGCAVARRKSSTTLIFPLPPQACSDEFCEEYPHNLIPTPGYWVECSRQKINMNNLAMWPGAESDSEQEENEQKISGRGNSESHLERGCSDLYEDDEDSEAAPSSRKKSAIEEQWDMQQGFELTSVEQETYEKYFYSTEHWNYFTNDEDLGPVILSIKQENLNGRDQFRILVRAISYTVHGLIPASCVFADRYNREEVVRSLGKEINLNPPLTLGQLPDTPEELLKLDQVFIKSELKVGVIYVKENQFSEEQILDNNENSPLFDEFLQLLGDKVRLRGFDKYKGGLDTVHDLTGLYSVYTNWRSIEIMFHVSTLLPYEKHDPQKLQRKRHIGNDIVMLVFLEADQTPFSPACIKSHFLHTFILVRPLASHSSQIKMTFDMQQVRVSARIKRKPTRYEVSVVTRDEVGAYKPYLWEQSVFEKGPMFREWILTKIVNGERASYSAPKFARMQERTRSQMLEDIVANLANHAETGQIPKPYRRGSWRPIGHMRPSSPLLDSVRDQFEDYDQLAKDFTRVFLNMEPCLQNAHLFDVVFLVGQSKQKARFIGVRAILGVRSRVFQEMLYGIQTGFGSPQVPVAELLARPAPTLMSPQSQCQRPKSSNFLQVPDIESPRPKSVPSSPMVKRAFSRLGTITAGWGRSIRSRQNSTLHADDKKKFTSMQDCSNKDNKEKQQSTNQLAVPRLSVCADAQKVDRAKLAQTEFSIIEFDPDTFRVLLDYLHTGSCPLTCVSIPGLICAAEHYDLPELLQACFHHAKQFLRIDVVCCMLISLENYYWRYTSASELVNMILAFVESKAHALFHLPDFLNLSESMVQMMMCRNLEVPEVRKFEAMLAWAKNKVKQKVSTKTDVKVEFRCIMERLTRDLKLHRISPQELIKVVLPSKAIRNERILETLMYQANSGMYRIQDDYIEACQQRIQKQDSRYSEWGESFDCGL
ncbi:uncharacterized protein LOC116348425 isoform X2 [Contarinia nasturtii]|uniref:uncharacterized protein LOC116348425 isoform X1 n=2 Tax=Contarinia nasturtii TaxID=265458 RepID=UPI0012D4A45F|nr:uncharacterized protein LOC116348425 isoform X1 [Contarinia nasturtii]XP_031635279.1 uncharacterized protein LOC116348425 isoform X2 [Contarinia nasturtii]